MRKYERQQPLQDNVEVAISMLVGVMPAVTRVLARPWVCPPDLGASPTSYRALYTVQSLRRAAAHGASLKSCRLPRLTAASHGCRWRYFSF